MHVASYRKIKPRRVFCNTVYKHSFSFSNHAWFHQRSIFIYTHQKVTNYNCLKDSKQLLNEPTREKKKKRKTTITTKTNTKESKELLLITSSCFFLPEVDRTYYQSYSKWRRRVHDVCLHMYWDVVIAIVICLNVICMSLEHYQMSQVMRRNTKLRLKLHSWVHYDSCFSFWACDKH